ncbi:MAG: sulfite exporter TauE/SafE family protein [Flavobacteriales bacterium]
MNELVVVGLIALVAFAYSMVGHGGASGYLALMGLLAFEPEVMKPTALCLNLCVSAIATVQFMRAGHFQWRSFWPFAALSIPMSFIGYGVELDPLVYMRVLAVCLLFAVARLLGLFGQGAATPRPVPIAIGMLVGAVLGLLSGMLGIGGGILLSPLMLLCGWGDAKRVAAISAPFILVNSTSGLLRASQHPFTPPSHMWWWLAVAIVAGLLGSWVGATRLIEVRLRQALGVVLLFASIKLFWP